MERKRKMLLMRLTKGIQRETIAISQIYITFDLSSDTVTVLLHLVEKKKENKNRSVQGDGN